MMTAHSYLPSHDQVAVVIVCQ